MTALVDLLTSENMENSPGWAQDDHQEAPRGYVHLKTEEMDAPERMASTPALRVHGSCHVPPQPMRRSNESPANHIPDSQHHTSGKIGAEHEQTTTESITYKSRTLGNGCVPRSLRHTEGTKIDENDHLTTRQMQENDTSAPWSKNRPQNTLEPLEQPSRTAK
ncbi:hypothetical protein H4582DRAFT_2065386 [Lactarius indigo]|nr:hypothetical protein H4582DRAFT_2065386 [Lactarius indigo]